jgi:hypothetical protein
MRPLVFADDEEADREAALVRIHEPESSRVGSHDERSLCVQGLPRPKHRIEPGYARIGNWIVPMAGGGQVHHGAELAL